MGGCYAELGDRARARAAWERAIELLGSQNRSAKADALRARLTELDEEPEA
jgi:predicted negative regulator of RcsB-dependent stress response